MRSNSERVDCQRARGNKAYRQVKQVLWQISPGEAGQSALFLTDVWQIVQYSWQTFSACMANIPRYSTTGVVQKLN
jgi:hypothetical protein